MNIVFPVQQNRNWFASVDELNNTPSRKDGIDAETEILLRIYGCEIIQEAGILLRLSVFFPLLLLLIPKPTDFVCVLKVLKL
jgi:hypothetical protein